MYIYITHPRLICRTPSFPSLYIPSSYPAIMSARTPNPADDLICPITLELPWDPVMASDGRIYERAAIEKHIQQHQGQLRSPMTNLPMSTDLTPAVHHKYLTANAVANGSIGGSLAEEWNKKVKKDKKDKEDLEAMDRKKRDREWEKMAEGLGGRDKLLIEDFRRHDELQLANFRKEMEEQGEEWMRHDELLLAKARKDLEEQAEELARRNELDSAEELEELEELFRSWRS